MSSVSTFMMEQVLDAFVNGMMPIRLPVMQRRGYAVFALEMPREI